jgi:DinB superfamily
MPHPSPVPWNQTLRDQLANHWDYQLRPRLEGLTDAEYFWEPVPGCWSVRPRERSTTSMAAGAGDFLMDYSHPEPEPAPVTTIAWRLAHITVSCLAMRNAGHFGGVGTDHRSWEYAATAKEALAQLDEQYAVWSAGVGGLGEADLARPVGAAEGEWAETPYAGLVLHINREVIHHGAEICLLRDLFARKDES